MPFSGQSPGGRSRAPSAPVAGAWRPVEVPDPANIAPLLGPTQEKTASFAGFFDARVAVQSFALPAVMPGARGGTSRRGRLAPEGSGEKTEESPDDEAAHVGEKRYAARVLGDAQRQSAGEDLEDEPDSQEEGGRNVG